ncbi:MAG: glycosyltransferase, partial [Deltaproteobacteria bacterium]|nr:glycosyltransferase [Deltaproteobacteria bacterium]
YTAGAALLNMGRLDEAQALCERALSAYPSHLDSCYLLAKIQDQKGHHEGAEKYASQYFKIRDGIEKAPASFGKVIHNSFWATSPMNMILGKVAYEKGAVNTSRQYFDKAVSQDPSGSAHRTVGQFYFSKGAFQEAESYLKIANRQSPDKITLYMLAECYGQSRETADQIATLEALLDRFPKELEKIEAIGKAQFDRSNYKLAAWCLERVLKETTGRKDLKDALRIARDWIRTETRQEFHRTPRPRENYPRISACLIVKNEESCLENCLNSVEPYVDELIVVDTGSTDGTVKIAEKHGARVYHHPWQDDFSLHRNQSMSYATGDWMLIIDADETLTSVSGGRLREVVREATAHAILFKVVNYSADGAVLSLLSSPRLFRNYVGCHYKGIVHNQACYPGPPEESTLNIYHYGYGLPEEKMAIKRRRTRALLEKQIEHNPSEPFSRYNLAVLEFMSGNFEKVIEQGQTVIQLLGQNETRDPAYANIFYYIAAAYNNLRNLQEAERYALEGLQAYPGHLDLFFVLSVVAFQKGDYAASVDYGERYLSIYRRIRNSPARGNNEYKTIGNQWVVKLNLSRAYHRLGEPQASSDYLVQVAREAPAEALAGIQELQASHTCPC